MKHNPFTQKKIIKVWVSEIIWKHFISKSFKNNFLVNHTIKKGNFEMKIFFTQLKIVAFKFIRDPNSSFILKVIQNNVTKDKLVGIIVLRESNKILFKMLSFNSWILYGLLKPRVLQAYLYLILVIPYDHVMHCRIYNAKIAS